MANRAIAMGRPVPLVMAALETHLITAWRETDAPAMLDLLREHMEAHGMCLFCGPVDDPMGAHPSHRENRIRALLEKHGRT